MNEYDQVTMKVTKSEGPTKASVGPYCLQRVTLFNQLYHARFKLYANLSKSVKTSIKNIDKMYKTKAGKIKAEHLRECADLVLGLLDSEVTSQYTELKAKIG